MIIQDDRTKEQKERLKWLVVGTDKFMSGWGLASGGTSLAAWACTEGALNSCFADVDNRKDLKRVRKVYADTYHPKGSGHIHIYIYKGAFA